MGADGGDVHGREQMRQQMQPFWQGFSNGRHELHRVVEVDDTVYAEGVWRAVNDRDIPLPDDLPLG